mgnify:CR=1 FL=1
MSSFASIEEIKKSLKFSDDGIEVFERSDGMGRSVRTKRNFKYNEILCSYGGKLISKEEQPDTDFALTISRSHVIDGSPQNKESHGHVGNFINDANGPIKCGQNNAVFSVGSIQTDEGRKKCIWIKSRHPIQSNTELFISYGAQYWIVRGENEKNILNDFEE